MRQDISHSNQSHSNGSTDESPDSRNSVGNAVGDSPAPPNAPDVLAPYVPLPREPRPAEVPLAADVRKPESGADSARLGSGGRGPRPSEATVGGRPASVGWNVFE